MSLYHRFLDWVARRLLAESPAKTSSVHNAIHKGWK
jgi:hypothetical protein